MLLFEVISAYYTRLQQPLISSQWDEVINAIQSLISELIYVSVNHAYHILRLGFHFRRLSSFKFSRCRIWSLFQGCYSDFSVTNPSANQSVTEEQKISRRRALPRSLSASSRVIDSKKNRKLQISPSILVNRGGRGTSSVSSLLPTQFHWLKRLRPKMGNRSRSLFSKLAGKRLA